MPSLRRISGASALDGGEATAVPHVEQRNAAGDQALDDAAHFWSKKGRQNDPFKAAVCRCLSLGFSLTEIARNIHRVAYAEQNVADVKLYSRIYSRVSYVRSNIWKESEPKSESKLPTAAAVDKLMAVMDKLDINQEGVAKNTLIEQLDVKNETLPNKENTQPNQVLPSVSKSEKKVTFAKVLEANAVYVPWPISPIVRKAPKL